MKLDDPTVFVGVYGTLSMHGWLDAQTAEEDAYSLFHSRAVALGWATPSAGDPGTERWGMNDAGQDWRAQASAPLAWFQVCLPPASSGDGTLPVQPLLACAEDALARVGRLDLDAVQVLLPLGAHRSRPSRLVSGLNRFRLADPAGRTPVRVTLDAGEDGVIQERATDLLDAAQSRNGGPFGLERCQIGVGGTPREPVVDELWMGEGMHPVTIWGSSPEWSFAAAGWLLEFLADVCREVGVSTSVLMTVEAAAGECVSG